MYVKIGEEDEHADHVVEHEPLSPAREVTAHVQGGARVGQGDDELDLTTKRMMIIHINSKLNNF